MTGLAVCGPQSEIGRLVVRAAVRVPEGMSLHETALAMRASNVSSALIVDSHAIVTERDLAAAWARRLVADDPVEMVASHHPLVVSHDLPIVEAAALMLNREVRHLIVLMADGSAGVVSLRDVMAVLLQAVKPELWLATLRISFGSSPDIWLG